MLERSHFKTWTFWYKGKIIFDKVGNWMSKAQFSSSPGPYFAHVFSFHCVLYQVAIISKHLAALILEAWRPLHSVVANLLLQLLPLFCDLIWASAPPGGCWSPPMQTDRAGCCFPHGYYFHPIHSDFFPFYIHLASNQGTVPGTCSLYIRHNMEPFGWKNYKIKLFCSF